ncbi:MAG TPA: serine/threonine-protein kinase, partial [Urbifossiella sp.]|nr:serine/threonine-protein kinase [Urbifossiella sp.]
GHAVERAINLFGRGIVARWQQWFAAHPADANAAVAGLAALPPAEARSAAKSIFLDLAPDASDEDLAMAVEFLTAIPPAVDRALVPDATGGRSVPASVVWDDPRSLLQLLPEDVPPYPAESPLTGTPYRLRELLGAGGFGAVYRAESPSLQHLPLAIKFCLDKSLLPALNQERSNLERLMRAGGRGSAHVVRLYGYDLDHATPYLVYEFVPGGDLTRLLSARSAALGRPPGPAEVLGWMAQITEGLAFAHAAGLVHRDLKPANVLAAGGDGGAAVLRLADFGIGGVAAAARAVRSRIGASTIDFLSLADQASLFRGAGTPLYMSPEQRRGAAPDPRHDLYALGVMWFQFLVGDVSRELPHGWAKELTVRYGVPAEHISLIERCVGWVEERPKNAGELLPLLTAAAGSPGMPVDPPPLPASAAPAAPTVTGASQVTPSPVADGRRRGLAAALARLSSAYDELNDMAKWTFSRTAGWGAFFALVVGFYSGLAFESASHGLYILGLPIGAVVWGVYVLTMRSSVNGVAEDLRQKAAAVVEEIAADFAPEAEAWGGRAALKHPLTVRRLKAELDPPAPPLAAPAPTLIPAATSGLTPDELMADPTRKALLVARLEQLRNSRKSVSESKDGSWFGVIGLWVILIPLAAWGTFAFLYEGMVGARGDVSSAAAGFVGAAVAVGVWFAMAAVRRAQDRKWAAAAARFEGDYSRLVESWGGRHVLESQEAMAAVTRLFAPPDPSGPAGFVRRLFGG